MPPIPFAPDDPACPSCGKPIKVGIPTVLKFGQTLHLRCWTLTGPHGPGRVPARFAPRAKPTRRRCLGRRRPDSRDGCRAR